MTTIFLRYSHQNRILGQKEDYFYGFETKNVKKIENPWIVPQKKSFPNKSRRIDMTGTIINIFPPTNICSEKLFKETLLIGSQSFSSLLFSQKVF